VNEEHVFTKLLYPLIFEERPLNSIDRILKIIESSFDEVEIDLLITAISSKKLSSNHHLIRDLSLVASENDLQAFFDTLVKRLTHLKHDR
jgi:hypothetical protein